MDTGERRGWEELRVEWKHVYIPVCKIDSQVEFAVGGSKLKLVRCDSLEGWAGVEGGGSFKREGT